MTITKQNLIKITDYCWEIPKTFRKMMKVPARFYASQKMLDQLFSDRSLEQLVNVATLPGIQKYALAMPDIHEGYGFPIGGVAGIEAKTGVISPGGVGYDINCGVRLLVSPLFFFDIKNKIIDLANQIQREVPSGVGRGGELKLNGHQLDLVLKQGARWAVENSFGTETDLENLEERGEINFAEPTLVSEQAKRRGANQLGTLGAGNHFLEIQKVGEVFDQNTAEKWGLSLNKITVMIHTGSRGLGHQVCTDYVRLLDRAMIKYNIHLPDRELAGAPFQSVEGQNYFKAMAAAANFAWGNRQLIMHRVRQAWQRILKTSPNQLPVLYDVAHNIAKLENYSGQELIVHRKGATRSFPGQPVIIPGSMGTASYVLAGTELAMQETFGSTCHGAGRQMSRTAALKQINYQKLQSQLKEKGVVTRGGSVKGLIEEAPQAYKNIDEVVAVVHQTGIAKKVVRLLPLAVIKG